MYIVIDVGGTNIRIATADLQNLGELHKFATPQNYDDALDLLMQHTHELSAGNDIQGVCIGLPGITNKDNSVIAKLPNLPEWDGKSMKGDLESRLRCQVFLHNDSALYGLAEARQIDPEGNEIIAYIGIGTGVGGARITHAQMDVVNYGFEPGHQIIDVDDLTTLESQIGGGDIQEQTGLLIQDIHDHNYWDYKHRLVAIGIYNSILFWSPDRVILGGGMINKGTYKLDTLTDKLSEINKLLPELPVLQQSQLGDTAGLQGAMLYLNSRING